MSKGKKGSGERRVEYPESLREIFREWGKQGGRPKTVPHNPEWEKCPCAECRRGRKAGVGAIVREEPVDEGAVIEEMLREGAGEVSGEAGKWMLVREVALAAGVDEQKVRDRALANNEVARLHKLGDGEWVVSREWAQARLALKSQEAK